MGVDHALHAGFEPLGQRDHPIEGLFGENLGQGCPDRCHRERIACQGAAHSADVGISRADRRCDSFPDLFGASVGPAGDAAADRLADGHEVRFEAVLPGVAARPGAECVRLVDHQQRPIPAGEAAELVVVAGVREDDADVGHHRFGQNTCDIAVSECLLEGRQVVELDHPGGERRIDRRPNTPSSRNDPIPIDLDDRLVG